MGSWDKNQGILKLDEAIECGTREGESPVIESGGIPLVSRVARGT